MADIFGVIADPTRRDLLRLLLDRLTSSDSTSVSEAGELRVGEMVERLGLSQPTVSKHLRVLRESGLVQVREVGQHRYYRLDPAPLETVEDWLLPFLGSDLDAADPSGSAVFAAWAGSNVPASLRRAAESFQHSGETGENLGRAMADATASVQRVIKPLRKVLDRRGGSDGGDSDRL